MVVYESLQTDNHNIYATTLVRLDASLGFPSLSTLQEHVGGYIEYIPVSMLMKGIIDMIVNEEGIPLQLPVNQIATQLLEGYHPQPIVGDVVVVTPNGLAALLSAEEEE